MKQKLLRKIHRSLQLLATPDTASQIVCQEAYLPIDWKFAKMQDYVNITESLNFIPNSHGISQYCHPVGLTHKSIWLYLESKLKCNIFFFFFRAVSFTSLEKCSQT